VTDKDLWIATFLAAILSGKTVKEAQAMADKALEIDRNFD